MNYFMGRPMVRSHGPPLGPHMTEGRAQNQLKIKKTDQHPAVPQQRLGIFARDFFYRLIEPAPAGEDGNYRQHTKHRLANGGVGGGDGGREKIQHRQAAQDSLENYSGHCSDCQPAHPAALVNAPSPYCDNDRQQADKFGDHPVRVLKLYPADHFGNLE